MSVENTPVLEKLQSAREALPITGEHPANMSIVQLISAYKAGKLSPVDVLQLQLERIRKHNPAINAFTHLDAAGALRAAEASEARWRRGAPNGPLDGISFTAKDNLMVAGYPCRKGSLTTSEALATETAPIVARCLEAGAIFLGLTTMPEFGAGPVTISPLTGITTNPWDTTKQSGGSTGGGAAAVAAGFCTFALGSDAGGSLRIPAALTGVVGLKPTGGRVPSYPPSVVGSLSAFGPVTHSAEDAALLLTLITAPDHRDATALPADGRDYLAGLGAGVRGWKMAWTSTMGYAAKVDSEIAAAVSEAVQVFKGLGADVEEADPGIGDPIESYLTLLRSGYRYSLRNFKPEQKELLAPALREILEQSPPVTLNDYLQAQEHCLAMGQRMQNFHRTYDVLITPTVAVPAFAAERSYPEDFEQFSNRRAWTPFTSLFNLTQQPAITIPIGLTRSGLPMGLHIVAARGEEAKVLCAAAAFEAARKQSLHPFND